jgi:hypothetical protein
MKNLLKTFLILIALTFMFIKVYVPLMNEDKISGKAERAIINTGRNVSTSKNVILNFYN